MVLTISIRDYTHGLLNTAVYVVPNLELAPEAGLAFTSLAVTSKWRGDNELCHTYVSEPPIYFLK